MRRIAVLPTSLASASCAAPSSAPQIVAGPTLLSRAIEMPWGAHSCTYVLGGGSGTFWTALAFGTSAPMIGHLPAPGSALPSTVRALDVPAP